MTAFAEHVTERDRWVRGPRGPLALVNAEHVEVEQSVWPVPGRWAPAPGGLTVTAAPDDEVVVDGVPVDGTVFVAAEQAVVPSVVTFPGGLAGTVADGTLRVWNPVSEALGRFSQIARFDDDAAWVASGRYEPVRDGLEARGSVLDAAGVPLPVAGHVTTTVGDVAVRLVAVRSAAFRGSARLQLIVQDATSALPEDDPSSTYSMGRFLYLDDPGGPAEVVLDWNRAVLPPCAFSYLFACPVPPAENRIPVAITAGERHPVDASGAVLH
jgi:uncharacterized protein